METIEESNLIGYLTKLPFEYREKLDINQGLKFGTEIEFMSESKKGIDKVFKLMNRAHMQNNKYSLFGFIKRTYQKMGFGL